MAKYKVTDAKPVDDVLSRVERLEAIVEILAPSIPEEMYNTLPDKLKKIFEKVAE